MTHSCNELKQLLVHFIHFLFTVSLDFNFLDKNREKKSWIFNFHLTCRGRKINQYFLFDPVFSSPMKRLQILCHDVTMFHTRSWRSPDVAGLNAPNWAAGGGGGLLPSLLIKSLIHSPWLHPRTPETGCLSWNLLICLWFWTADLFSHEPTWKPAEPASKMSLCAAMAKTGFLEIWIFTQRPECKQRNISSILKEQRAARVSGREKTVNIPSWTSVLSHLWEQKKKKSCFKLCRTI